MRKLLLPAIIILLCGFQQQPASERQAQKTLPIASSDMWDVLAKAKIELNSKGVFTAITPPELKAMSGKAVTVNGFILPIETGSKQSHFLLSKRTPTCPYCLPGGPNEIFDVYMKDPITYSEGIWYITGKFELIDDVKSGLFFRLSNATAHSEEPAFPKNRFQPAV